MTPPDFVSCQCPAGHGNPCPLTTEQCAERERMIRLRRSIGLNLPRVRDLYERCDSGIEDETPL
jgi:hypothetical protein